MPNGKGTNRPDPTISGVGGGFIILIPADDQTEHGRPGAYVSFGNQAHEVTGTFEHLGYKTYAGGYGLLWAASPYLTHPDLFRGRRVIHYLTDGKAVSGLSPGQGIRENGGSRHQVVNALHARLISLHCDVTFLEIQPRWSVATLLASGVRPCDRGHGSAAARRHPH